ncbi:MAG: phage holin family protein [Gammaproteobacteria bacterium]|nr:MAG: phage holin family protein [Gammaproteobacteria bacterium]
MIFGILILWGLSTIGLFIITAVVPGIRAHSTGDLFLASLILGLMNAFIRPLLWFLTWPLTVITFGLFALLVNAVMIQLTSLIVPGFEVDNFASALLATVIMLLLVISGFIFIQWFLFDGVMWMHMNEMHPGLSM